MILSVDSVDKLIYIYSDIKPDKILIDKDWHIQLNDFDSSKNCQKNFFSSLAKESPTSNINLNTITNINISKLK